MQHYSFHSQLVVRTPTSNFDTQIDFDILNEAVKDKTFMEAVYLATPALYHAAINVTDFSKKENQSIAYSLAKYLMRSRSRCTPFGLFAGVGVVNWDLKTNITIGKKENRHTRLDMNYLCALALSILNSEIVRQQVSFFPNTSIYYLDDEIRFIEYYYSETQREHKISSVKINDYIKLVLELATKGLNFKQLVLSLVSDDISEEEAKSFINDLIDTQLLVSELNPEITGSDFLTQILSVLNRSSAIDPEVSFIFESLKNVDSLLCKIDSSEQGGIESYKKIISLLDSIKVPYEESRLFQTDKNIDVVSDSLSVQIQSDLFNAINKLNNIAVFTENTNVSEFISRFYDRYEDEEVSLLHALDSEMGVGYLAFNSGDYTPLIEGITLGDRDDSQKISWKDHQRKIFSILQRCSENHQKEVSFSEFNFELTNEKVNLCPSTSIIFRMINEHQVYLEGVGGSSAVNLLGRFAHSNEGIKKIIFDIAHEEQDRNKEVIFAEIVHLPESRVGNILLRPDFRSYEIPFLAKSSKDLDQQLLLRDIYISIKYNKVVLRHKPTNKIVIPRLGTAHNYSYQALPVYQFLCDVQSQYFQNSLGFNWGDIGREFTFLPRVVEGNVVLSPAMWQLDLIKVTEICQFSSQEEFSVWRNQYKLPDSFVLAEGDNELFIDANNSLMFTIFKNSIKEKQWVVLKEHYINQECPVKNYFGAIMANQFVAALIRQEPVYTNHKVAFFQDDVQRNFSIGSEWLYFKLYCGAKSADTILQNGIKLVIDKAQQEKWIDKWFFIKYNDPNSHIRLRFHLTDISYLQNIVSLIDLYIRPFDVIWKIQTDTYKRELERYGYSTIHQAETIFYLDSTAYLDFLAASEGDEREHIKWLWGLRSIDKFLTEFGYSLQNKKRLIETIRNSFAQEFNLDQHLKSQLDKKYRENRKDIEQFIEGENVLFDSILTKKMQDLKIPITFIISHEKENIDSQVASYIHMFINRIISSNQRLHELLIYDFLLRNYISQMARKKIIA